MSHAGGTPVPQPQPTPPAPAPKAGLAERTRHLITTPQFLTVLTALLFGMAAAGGAGAFMEHYDAPFWAELAVAELVAVGVMLGAFEALGALLRRIDAKTLYAIQDAAITAHWAGTCGCAAGVMLADCDAWNDALEMAAETEGGAL
ncbi:hypothetical protein ACGF07_35310 [Kitasatospora sp. NPDC048194]|uniref:hypothetical protein n=1 Tax=Kitasatospora sp. NPDC048194 TaxID=3364045 RepID=UPI003720B61C